MLFQFINANRQELIARTRAKLAKRLAPSPTERELTSGVPLFLDQLVGMLRHVPSSATETMGRSAAVHGVGFLSLGYTVAQVVHDYGDVCQAITELAEESDAPITIDELQILNLCLDDAIAGAVAEYAHLREQSIVAEGAERLGALAHEMRNALSTAMLSFDTIKRGVAGTGGNVAAMHTRSLLRLGSLIDRSLTQVRLDAEIIKREPVVLAELIEEAEIAAMIQARAHGLELSVSPVDIALVVEVDRQVLAGALANLLQNAFKFTRANSHVSLRTHATPERVRIDVEDQCGGLPGGETEALFRPFEQRGANRSGLGLGLSIARRAVEANGGKLLVHNLPPVGCRFTIDLSRVARTA